MIRVKEIQEGRPGDCETLQGQLELDWRREQEQRLTRSLLDRMARNYEIRRESLP